MLKKIERDLEERKKNALNVDIEKIDLRTFLEREDVMRELAYEAFALPCLMSRMFGRTWVTNPHEKSYVISEKIKLLPWYPNESIGFDYGSGYMPASVELRKQVKRKEEDPDLYWVRIYFSSWDNGEASIERGDLDLKKAEAVYKILERQFELLDCVPTRESAKAIAEIAGCRVG